MAARDLRSFRRFELKFVLTELVASRFASMLGPWTLDDPVAGGLAYGIESLYYDTDDLRFYWEKVEGLRLRRKLRVRRYLDGRPISPSTPVYIEIKQRLDRVTQKRRVKIPFGRTDAFLSAGVRPGVESDPVVDEIDVLLDEFPLRPRLVTGYARTARVGGPNDPGLRVTFDRGCYYRALDPSLDTTVREGGLLPPGWVIVEVKINERLPGWLATLIGEAQLSLTRISKYVQGVERAALAPRSMFFHEVERQPSSPNAARLLPSPHPVVEQVVLSDPTTQGASL